MAEITTVPDKTTSAGVKPTTVAFKTADTHNIDNRRAVLLRVNNASAKVAKLTFTVPAQSGVHGPLTTTLEAAKEAVTTYGPFSPDKFGKTLSIKTDTEVSVEVIALPLHNALFTA